MKKNHLKMAQRLASNKGESLIETLISVVISSLAITMFTGAVISVSRMITTSNTTMNQYYKENAKLSAQDDGGLTSHSLTITFSSAPTGSSIAGTDLAAAQGDLSNHITVYKNAKKSVASYRISE